MRSDYSGCIHYGITQCLRMLTLIFANPDGIETKCRILSRYTFYRAKYLARINRQLIIMAQLAFTRCHAHQRHAVSVRFQIKIVTDMYCRD